MNRENVPTTPPQRQVRAAFDDATVTVYQAYSPHIADAALAAGTFVPPFKPDRMTWIKPSFLWMMYRSGWATKPGQERILAIRITRTGFEQALADACLSHYDRDVYANREEWVQRKESSQVRVQWDPERSPRLAPLPWRSIQIGLSGPAAQLYTANWITEITDITQTAQDLHELIIQGDESGIGEQLSAEKPYPLPPHAAHMIGATTLT